MIPQTDPARPTRSLNFLRHEDGSWNLLVLGAGALGAAFLAYILLDPLAPVPVKIANPAQTPGPSAPSTAPAK